MTSPLTLEEVERLEDFANNLAKWPFKVGASLPDAYSGSGGKKALLADLQALLSQAKRVGELERILYQARNQVVAFAIDPVRISPESAVSAVEYIDRALSPEAGR